MEHIFLDVIMEKDAYNISLWSRKGVEIIFKLDVTWWYENDTKST